MFGGCSPTPQHVETSDARHHQSRIDGRRRQTPAARARAPAALESVRADHRRLRRLSRGERQELSAGERPCRRWRRRTRHLGEAARLSRGLADLRERSLGPAVAWLQQALAGKDVAVSFTPYAGAIDGIFGPVTQAAVRALQTWAGVGATGVVEDNTWFVWMTPGSAQQLTLERACGLLNNL